jgi:plastocyanin
MRRLCAMLLLLFLAMACNKEVTDPPPPETNTVTATNNNLFLPPNAPVRVGGRVTWEFQGVAHSVIFRVRAGAPDNIQEPISNTTEVRTFTTAGQFIYDCGVHPAMSGIITVVAP